MHTGLQLHSSKEEVHSYSTDASENKAVTGQWGETALGATERSSRSLALLSADR